MKPSYSLFRNGVARMRNKRLVITCIVLSCLYAISYFVLFGIFSGYMFKNTETNNRTVMYLTQATATIEGESYDITLPYTFQDLDARTVVTITATFSTPEGGFFYYETERTPMLIYINDELIFEYGAEGTYPSSLIDPATWGGVLPIDSSSSITNLTIIYESPITEDSFTADSIMFGTQNAIYLNIVDEIGFAFLFSSVLIMLGVFLIITALFIMIFERRSITFLWLGLAILNSGLWIMCDIPLFIALVGNPSLLYIISFFGMIVFPIPLIYFGLATINFVNKKPLLILCIIHIAIAIGAIIGQAFGITSILMLESFFEIMIPLIVIIFAISIFYEYIYYHNSVAQRFTFPSILLAVFMALDYINTKTHFAQLSISFFQIGIVIFMITMGIIGGYYIKDALKLKERSQQLEFNMKMMDYHSKALKRHSNLIMDTTDSLRKQRHDLRHQLTVIRDLATHEKNEQLLAYLDTVVSNIPSSQIHYCNNVTINAIISHSASICQHHDIDLKVNIAIPPSSSETLDSDYCIIFGNLLENAAEACQNMKTGRRYITLSSRIRYHTLIITMENSFDGQYQEDNGKFHSRKRTEYGIGLTSIQTAARKYDGDAQFKIIENTFHSSIYLTITESEIML